MKILMLFFLLVSCNPEDVIVPEISVLEPGASPEIGESWNWMLVSSYYQSEDGVLHIRIAGLGQKDVYVVLWKVTQPIMFYAGDQDKEGYVHIENAGTVPLSGIYIFGHHPNDMPDGK